MYGVHSFPQSLFIEFETKLQINILPRSLA